MIKETNSHGLHKALKAENMSDEHFIGELLQKYGTYALAALAGLIVLTLLVWNLFAKGATENDYITASNNFTLLKRNLFAEKGNKDEAMAALDKLTVLLNQFPEMQTRYDSEVAQLLLAAGEIQKALPFAERFIARKQPAHLETFTDFGRGSIALAKGDTHAALEEGKQLATTAKDGSLLNAFNTIQLALLEQTQNPKAAKEFWEKIKQSQNQDSYKIIAYLFNHGSVNFNQFIESQLTR